MMDWIKSILIVLAVVYLISDGIWKSKFSDEDLLFEQIPTTEECS